MCNDSSVSYQAAGGIDAIDAPIAGRDHHLRVNQLLSGEHHSVFDAQRNCSTTVLYCFASVLDLENTSVRRERRTGDVILDGGRGSQVGDGERQAPVGTQVRSRT
jgi:hypothetical protein